MMGHNKRKRSVDDTENRVCKELKRIKKEAKKQKKEIRRLKRRRKYNLTLRFQIGDRRDVNRYP